MRPNLGLVLGRIYPTVLMCTFRSFLSRTFVRQSYIISIEAPASINAKGVIHTMPETAKTSNISGRTFNICTDLVHPETNEIIITLDDIEETCRKHATIKTWAYCFHDKDRYNENDEKNNPQHTAGTLKPAHVHIVISTAPKPVDVETIAKWFGIPSNFIELPKGKGKFAECVMYLTHESEKEQSLGKYRYPDSDVKTNLPSYREFVDNLKLKKKICKNADASDIDLILHKVCYDGMTINEVIKKYPEIYVKHMDKIKKCRIEFLSRIKEMPKVRINIYITGRGGLGKGIASEALARALIDPDGEKEDSEIFFYTGSSNTTFEGYDGQPVIIWDDSRSSLLHKKFEDRGEIFKVFDPFPKNITQNIKYGSIRLTNEINIINSVQGWKEFLDNISGEYTDKNGEFHKSEDKGQSYRRFPLIIQLDENGYTLRVNKGVLNGTNEYEAWEVIENIEGNFQEIAKRFGDNLKLRNKINNKTLLWVIEKYNALLESLCKKTANAEDTEIMFWNYGKTPLQKIKEKVDAFNNSFNEESYESIEFRDIPLDFDDLDNN